MSTRISSLCFGEEGGGKRPSVRRCLFGKPNRDIISKVLSVQDAALQAQDAKRFAERWGLNPETGEPVEGSPFVCTPVEKDSVPEFYTRGYAPRKSKPVVSPRDSWRGPYTQSLFSDDRLSVQQVLSRKSVKRRLQLDRDDDQENKQIVSTKVFICERKPSQPSPVPSSYELRPIAPPSVSSLSLTALSCSAQQSPSHPVVTPRVQCTASPNGSDRVTTNNSPSPSTIRRRSRSSVPPPFLDLATPRSLEQTPQQRQTVMKDYFPLQKRRATSTKSLFEV